MADHFDRMIGALHDLPDVTTTRPATIRAVIPLVGASQTFIVQTYRQQDQGDTIFIEHVDAEKSTRLVIPPGVANMIASQRDSLSTKVRRKNGKRIAEERKARGEKPGFMKKGK